MDLDPSPSYSAALEHLKQAQALAADFVFDEYELACLDAFEAALVRAGVDAHARERFFGGVFGALVLTNTAEVEAQAIKLAAQAGVNADALATQRGWESLGRVCARLYARSTLRQTNAKGPSARALAELAQVGVFDAREIDPQRLLESERACAHLSALLRVAGLSADHLEEFYVVCFAKAAQGVEDPFLETIEYLVDRQLMEQLSEGQIFDRFDDALERLYSLVDDIYEARDAETTEWYWETRISNQAFPSS